MFDDAVMTIGVYGFENGLVYTMDPHDWTGMYLKSRSSSQLDSKYAEYSDTSSRSEPPYRPLCCFPISIWDQHNFCILKVTNSRFSEESKVSNLQKSNKREEEAKKEDQQK